MTGTVRRTLNSKKRIVLAPFFVILIFLLVPQGRSWAAPESGLKSTIGKLIQKEDNVSVTACRDNIARYRKDAPDRRGG